MVKRLYRNSRDRILGGVCSGMANYFGVDPTFMRVLWVIAALLWGIGILAYLLLWIIIPEKG